MKKKLKTVHLYLDGETLIKLRKVATLANTTVNTVINVILVLELNKKNPPRKK